jgi:anti-sigma factor RsiW
MNCREVTEFLLDYFAGGLPAGERAVFDEHLADCPDCRTYLAHYRQTVLLGAEAFAGPAEAVPEDLVRAILAARPR